MRDKRNRGCFGQTLFGHGQSTYKRGYHLSLSLSLWARFTRAVRSLSRLHPSLLSSFTTLACLVRGVYLHKPANCVLVSFVPYERPFQYPLPIPDAWKDPFTRENWPFARTSSSPFCLPSFHNYSDYSPLSRSSYLTFPRRFVASRKTRQLFHPFRKALSIVSKMFNERELFASTTRNLFGFLLF